METFEMKYKKKINREMAEHQIEKKCKRGELKWKEREEK